MTAATSPVEAILTRLERVRRSGGGWVARCPAHEDREPSLSIREGDDGRALIHCHAGCEPADIMRALGLEMADLYVREPTPSLTTDRTAGRGRIVATYDYHDESGQLLYQAVRYTPKQFRQRRPDGRGGWAWNLNGTRRVLYRLPEILGADWDWRVVVCEGEKDADQLAALGIVATTCAQGANGWRPDYGYAESLQGRHVAIIPDNDEPGRQHAEHVAQSLAGVAASVRVVALPGLPEKGDVSDWLDVGGTLEALEALIAAAPEWAPTEAIGEPCHAATTVTLDTVAPEAVSWLWPGRIPLGKLTILDGDPGLGKSLVSLDIAARLSVGRPMPDDGRGDLAGPATVVLVSVEDGLADTIRPRLDLAGADTSRVVAITSIVGADGHDRPVILPDDWQHIEAVVTERAGRLVILDPLMALLGGDVNSYRDQDARRALLPGVQMAERTGAALVVIRHLNKGAGASAIYRGGGSIGIAGAARSVLLVAKDPDDDTEARRIVAGVKANLAAPAPALAYRIESGTSGHPYLVWEGVTAHTANQLLAMPSDPGERGVADEARAFLLDALAGGPRPTKDVLRDAKALGISEAAIRRARTALGVRAEKTGFGADGPWCLALPEAPKAFAEPQRRSSQNVNAFGEYERLWEAGRQSSAAATGSGAPAESLRLRLSPATTVTPDTLVCRGCGVPLYTPESASVGMCARCRTAGAA